MRIFIVTLVAILIVVMTAIVVDMIRLFAPGIYASTGARDTNFSTMVGASKQVLTAMGIGAILILLIYIARNVLVFVKREQQ